MPSASAAAPIDIDDEDMDEQTRIATENQRINEEYKIWKKNTPFLYDLVLTHALTWPSLTCQWLPDMESPPNANYTKHRLILGTHTSRSAQDHLMIAEVTLPKSSAEASGSSSGNGQGSNGKGKGKEEGGNGSGDVLKDYSEERKEIGSYDADTPASIKIIQRINHHNEINRARYMPQNPNLIATKTTSGDVYVFDRTKHSSEPNADGICRPDIKLKGQRKEGYGLSWSTVKAGNVLSASDDTTVCHWDINAYTKASNTMDPLTTYKGHTAVVEDVDWHSQQDYTFASVGDDRKLMIWDTRSDNPHKAAMEVEGHMSEVNSCAFSQSSPNLILTGSSDQTVALWDIRKIDLKLHSFESHTDEVLQLAWSPHGPTIFASTSSDRRVHIWDVSRIGEEQTPDDAEDGPPELLFVHGGHTQRPTDLSWCPNEQKRWHLATVGEDNTVMCFQPSRNIYAGDEVVVGAEELE